MINMSNIQEPIDAFYSIISGKAGEARNWDSFRDLFHKGASLTVMRLTEQKAYAAVTHDVESYITRLAKFLESKDFYEYGFRYSVRIFGNIAHVYSEYEAKASMLDNKPIKRGVNLVQLVYDGAKWRILNMLWQDESRRA